MSKNRLQRIIDSRAVSARNTGIVTIGGGSGGTGGGGGGGTLAPHPLAVSGGYHTGLLPWGDLNKTGSALADLATRPHSALTGIGPNDHHNQATAGNAEITVSGTQVITLAGHDIFARHSVSGGANFDIIGQSGAGVLARLTPSQDVSAGIERILKSSSNGGLLLKSLQVKGTVDVTDGGDLFVAGSGAYAGSPVLFADSNGGNVGILTYPDPQFALDVNGPVRAQWFIGPHAIQLKNVLLLSHFDGRQPFETNYYGEPNGHMGQVATVGGGVIYRPGMFGTKAVQIAASTTNELVNPSFEVNVTDGWAFTQDGTGGAAARSSFAAYVGTYCALISPSSTGSSLLASNTVSVPNGSTVHVRARVYRTTATATLELYDTTGTTIRASASASLVSEWELLTASWTNSTGSAATVRLRVRNSSGGTALNIAVDACQLEVASASSPYCDGTLGDGHTWTGTAHNSTSTRTTANFQYPTAGNINTVRGTIMGWVNLPVTGGNRTILHIAGTSAGTISLRVAGTTLVGLWGTSSEVSGGTIAANTWAHVTLAYSGTTLVLYINGIQVATGSMSGFSGLPATMGIGRLVAGGNVLNGYLDDLVITSSVMSANEIRAVYESNAPVLAESSRFSFRATPKSLVWADDDGLKIRDTTGNPVAIFYAGDASGYSWGGASLDPGDILLGNQTAGQYIKWDVSAGTMVVSAAINVISVTGLDLDSVPDGSTYKRTTVNEKTGAGRGFTGLNSAGDLVRRAVPGAGQTASPTGAGLYLGSDFMGYYNGSVWRTYMDNAGQFALSGAGTNALTWNGTTLVIDGQVVVGTTNKIWLNDSNDGTLAIGGSVKANAPFKVSAAGAITAISGSIGGWGLATGEIGSGSGIGRVGLIANTGTTHATVMYAGSGTVSSAPFRVTSFGHVHARNLVASVNGSPIDVYDYNDGIVTGSLIASFLRPSGSSSGFAVGAQTNKVRLSRTDGTNGAAYLANEGTGYLEVHTNGARAAVFQSSGDFSTYNAGGDVLGRIKSTGAVKSRYDLTNGALAAAFGPEALFTMTNNQAIDIGTRYGLMYIINSSSGSSALFLLQGITTVMISQSTHNHFSTTIGTASRVNVGDYSGAGGELAIENKRGSSISLHIIYFGPQGI